MKRPAAALVVMLVPLAALAAGSAAGAPDPPGAGAAAIQVVLIREGGVLERGLAGEIGAKALLDAEAAWVWTGDAAPRLLTGSRLTEGWSTLQREGLRPGPDSLEVDLPEGDVRASGTVIAAPAAMWRQVPESWLPRFDVPRKGSIRLPRDASIRWRLRYAARESGSWWTDVPAGRSAVYLYPVPAPDLVATVTTTDGEAVDAAVLTVLDEVASIADPSVIAVVRTDVAASLRIPTLPADHPATFLVGAPGYPARPYRGRPRDLPAHLQLAAGGELRGRFVAPQGQPVADVEVVAEGWLTDDVPVRFERRTRSGEDGAWSLPALSRRPLVLTAHHAGFAPLVAHHDLSHSGFVDLGDVVLERGAVLAVVVLDRDGAPVAGADVSVDRLPVPAVASDEHGRARLAGLPEGRPLDLVTKAEGYLPGQLPLAVPWPDEARVVLTRGFTVRGRFVDAAGLPVDAGKVRVASENHFRFEDLEPGGGFELMLDPGVRWSLELSSPATRRRTVELQPGRPGERRELGDLAAPPGLTVFGTLVSADDGTAVAGGRIWMPRAAASGVLVSWLYGDVAETTSDRLGRFEVAGLAPEPGLLRVDALGFARTELAVQPDPDVPELDLGVVELTRGATVVVRVEGLDDDTPSPRARLDLRREWQDLDMLAAPVVDGEAELTHVPAGRSRLTIVAGTDLLCERQVAVEPDDSLVEVDCDARRSAITGRVVIGDHAAGAGLLAFSRGAASDDSESVIQTRLTRTGLRQQSVAGGGRPEVLVDVDDDGAFRTDRLSPGRWLVTWQPISGTATPPRPVNVPEGDAADLLVRVPGLGLAGLVVDDEGAPVARARVRELGSGAFGLSGPDGVFRLDGLGAGEMRIQAQDADRYSEALAVRLEPDRPHDPVRLVVSALHQGRIPVQVWDRGLPAAGAFVFLQTDANADLRLASTGGGGATEMVVPAPYPSRLRVAVRHEGRWAFGEWTEWRRAHDGIEVEIPPPGEILVETDETQQFLSVLDGDGWDLGRLLSRLGAPPTVSSRVPLLLTGLPAGRYVLSLASDPSAGLAGNARTIVVSAGHRETVEVGKGR